MKVGAVNVVALIGNLATEPDLREVGDGKKVVSFLIAVDRRRGDEADFVRVSAWDRQAETCAEHLTKGRRVARRRPPAESQLADAGGREAERRRGRRTPGGIPLAAGDARRRRCRGR